jgi:hypothetical protein
MPEVLYLLPTWLLALIILAVTVGLALSAFELAHRYPLFRIGFRDGTNDAISGALGAIGVFYGITVGLIAIDVWQRHAEAQSIAAREAASIQTLYLTVRSEERLGRRVGSPGASEGVQPAGGSSEEMRRLVADYLKAVICDVWEPQRRVDLGDGRRPDSEILPKIREAMIALDPQSDGQLARYEAAIQSLNHLTELRRLRTDASNDRLSGVMWAIILLGALMTMTVVGLFRIEDRRLHRVLVGLLSGFLSLVLLMIVVNDRPFLGDSAVEPTSYTDIGWILRPRYGSNPFQADSGYDGSRSSLKERCDQLKPSEQSVAAR